MDQLNGLGTIKSAVSFAPLRPVDFVNFAGRGKACFSRGGAGQPVFPRGGASIPGLASNLGKDEDEVVRHLCERLIVRDNAMMMSSRHPTFAPPDVGGDETDCY